MERSLELRQRITSEDLRCSILIDDEEAMMVGRPRHLIRWDRLYLCLMISVVLVGSLAFGWYIVEQRR
jgi:hypothetical protein